MILKSLTSFGAFTLDNGTTRRTRRIVPAFKTTTDSALALPGGGFYDPYGSNPAPIYPGKLTVSIRINQTSKANCAADVDSITALIGTKATLTGKNLNDATVTSSARLTQVTDSTPEKTDLTKRHLELSFQQYTNWA